MKNLNHILYPNSLSERISEFEYLEDLKTVIPHRYSKIDKSPYHNKEVFTDKNKKVFFLDKKGKSKATVRRSLNEIKLLVQETIDKNQSNIIGSAHINEKPKFEHVNLLKKIKFGDWISNNDWLNHIEDLLKEAIDVDWVAITHIKETDTYCGVFMHDQKIGLMNTGKKRYSFKKSKGPTGWLRQNINQAKIFSSSDDFYNHICDHESWDAETKLFLTKGFLAISKDLEITEGCSFQVPEPADITIEE